MSMFALVFDGQVAQIAPEQFPVVAAMTWVDVTDLTPRPQPGWVYDGAHFTPPPVTPMDPAQQAASRLAGGLTITCTSAPALDGTYACDLVTQQHIQAEMIAILLLNKFADGDTTLVWPDITGTNHTFPSANAFKAYALATAAFVAGCAKVANGSATTLPSNAVTLP